MEEKKIVIELTVADCIEVYKCIRIKVDRIKDECYRTQNLLDEMETTHVDYRETKDNLEMLTNALVYHTEMMDKFRPEIRGN